MGALKFNRIYQLSVGLYNGGVLNVALPFTCEFDITRNTLTSANVAQFRIYNLSQKNRGQLLRNALDYGLPFQSVTFRAGYGTGVPPIMFTGNVSQAWSVREGTNFITTIECYDGGYAFINGTYDRTWIAGTPRNVIIADMMNTLPFVTVGAIGDFPDPIPPGRNNTYSGRTTDLLKELTGGAFFIDSGKAYALKTNEYLLRANGVTVVNAATGLLGTPVLERSILHFEMLMEPGLNIGESVLLQSSTADAIYNGQYKITAVKHRGIVSPVVSGRAITTGEFYFSKTPTPVASFLQIA